MVDCLIVCRSLTVAQRMVRVLEQNGITAAVVRLPSQIADAGCGYAARVSEHQLGKALVLLRQKGFKVDRVYTLFGDGSIMEYKP